MSMGGALGNRPISEGNLQKFGALFGAVKSDLTPGVTSFSTGKGFGLTLPIGSEA